MTAPTTIPGSVDPFAHTPWCHVDKCITCHGESVIHRHLAGMVNGVSVYVERIDYLNADGRIRVGDVEVRPYSYGEQGLNTRDVDQLTDLLQAAKLFAQAVS